MKREFAFIEESPYKDVRVPMVRRLWADIGLGGGLIPTLAYMIRAAKRIHGEVGTHIEGRWVTVRYDSDPVEVTKSYFERTEIPRGLSALIA